MLHEHLHRLFKSGRFSDLTLVCGDAEFHVHKIVLYTQSDVFHSMLGLKYKVRISECILPIQCR